MHNRIKDVKSGSDDNGGIVEVKDKICFDGIDIGKYANFRTLFNTLKKRNASSTDADHTHHLVSSQQERSGCRSVSVAEDCTPSIPFQQLNVTSENSNDERIVENCQASDELQPGTCSTVMIPTNFVRKKLQLHVNKQICCKEMATLNATSKTREIPSAAFDLLLDCSKKEIQIDKDEGNKIVNDTAPLVRPHPFKNGTARSIETTLASSEIQMPSSSLLFRRTFEFLTREKEGIGRIDKGPVGRSLSFDDAYTVTKGKCLVRNTVTHYSRENPKNLSKEWLFLSHDFTCAAVHQGLVKNKFSEGRGTLLARKLAKTERIAQLLQIQLKFYDKTNDAKFACRLADIIDRLKLLLPNDQFRDKALQVLNSVNPSIGVNDEKSVFLDNLLKEIEYDKRKCCEKLVEYVRKHPPLLMELQNQANEKVFSVVDGEESV
ncbi:unnamed protein product [Litomosoides sigmodontis]|uniref:Uncharacterized protein n=1 Tax=Litomosoides sigmodontis TaxID=42156 RepID=A0A3P6SWP8_LITSI|nr:unnamed protein product [Litomosoides sigmodontis]